MYFKNRNAICKRGIRCFYAIQMRMKRPEMPYMQGCFYTEEVGERNNGRSKSKKKKHETLSFL